MPKIKDKYSHRDRLELILAGEQPDRYAASFWRHFYHKESTAKGTAETMLDFQKEFDWDFMKINPRADYHIEDWGFKQKWSSSEFEKHTVLKYPVEKTADWDKVEPLSPNSPVLAEHLQVVSLIRKGMGRDFPILMTVFTPLAVAGRMVEDDKLLVESIRNHPDKIHRALKNITATFVKYVQELRNAGADGIFFATTQWASSNLITWSEYEDFGVPYDLKVINATEKDSLNLFHVCSSNNYLSQLAKIDYNCKMYNWDSDDPTNLQIDKSYDLLKGKTPVGGVDQRGWLLKSEPVEIPLQMQRIKKFLDPRRVIIGPGCSIAPEVPRQNLELIRENL
ncbi:MAG TPA: uroporphyrinogen decarboxylase family protein [candidate division Zixibacteria bacterium]|nr:uroporphyrinogen decarboxylase family protein [candidate division Zixibacteria bacterium]